MQINSTQRDLAEEVTAELLQIKGLAYLLSLVTDTNTEEDNYHNAVALLETSLERLEGRFDTFLSELTKQ